MIYYIISFGILLLLLSIVVSRLAFPKRGKHSKKIKQADKVLKKIAKFENPGAVIKYLRQIDPYVFEELLLSAFKKQGIKIKRNLRYSGDGGIDGKIFIEGKMHYVQAKRYQSFVSKVHISEFSDLCKRKDVGGFFIHTGKTPNFNIPNNITLLSGIRLVKLIQEAY